MTKIITVKLEGKGYEQYVNVAYSLDLGKGKCTNSEIINHCLTELALFEEFTDDQLTNWLESNYPEKYAEFLKSLNHEKDDAPKVMTANPSKRFQPKGKKDGNGKR
jgi:hypothetical protein